MSEHVNSKNDSLKKVSWQEQLTRRTFLKLGCLAAGLTSLSLTGCTVGTPTPTQKIVAQGPFRGLPDMVVPLGLGVNLRTTSTSNTNTELKRIASLGFRFVRLDLLWNSVEHQQGQYNFASYDHVVDTISNLGMHPLFILDYTNPLYESTYSPAYTAVGPHTDTVRQAFANFAAAAAGRFKGRGVIWEIWNEPDTARFWYPNPDADAYTALVKTAVHAMRQADPNTTIIGPAPIGLEPQYRIAFSFLERCFQLGLLDLVDAVSVHPYRIGSPESVAADYTRLRSLIGQYASQFSNVPIVSSEWGYSRTVVSPEQQAAYFVRLFLINLMNNIPLSIWYDSHDGPDPNFIEDHYGLVTWNNQPQPVSFAAQTLTHELADYRFTERQELSDSDDYALLFVNGTAKKQVLWTATYPHTITIPMLTPSVTVTSMTGEKSTLTTVNNTLTVGLTDSPQYLSFS